MSNRKARKARRQAEFRAVERNYMITQITNRNETGLHIDHMPAEQMGMFRAAWHKGRRVEINSIVLVAPDQWSKETRAYVVQRFNSDSFYEYLERRDTEFLEARQGDWSSPAAFDFSIPELPWGELQVRLTLNRI